MKTNKDRDLKFEMVKFEMGREYAAKRIYNLWLHSGAVADIVLHHLFELHFNCGLLSVSH